MSGFIGVPGAMVELLYRGGLSTKTDRPVTFKKTLGGKVKGFVGPLSRREWSVSFDLIGAREVSGLIDMARAGGEVMWYPSDASLGNLLSPQASGFETVPAGGIDAGMVQLPDGTVARTIVHAGTWSAGNAHGSVEMVPVRPGDSVTVGVWALGGSRLSGWWRAADGTTQTSWAGPINTFTGWQWREYTIEAPAGASFVSLTLSSGTQWARPSIAWGSVGRDQPGKGSPRNLVHGLSEELVVVHLDDDSYGSFSVTITEVG